MESKKINIKDRLPKYEAPKELWTKIEMQLNNLENEKPNAQLAAKLPQYKAPDIFKAGEPIKETKSFTFYALRIAAGIILILALGFGLKQFNNRTKTQISYSFEKEAISDTLTAVDFTSNDSDFKTLLHQKCTTNPGVCEQRDYEELYSQLKDIENEQKVLLQALKQYKSPEIESHLIRITNDKIKIENYILKLFS